jgi:acyl carrier protein
MTLKAATVEQAVRDALNAVRPGSGPIDGDADLVREVGLDSMLVMDLVMEIEDRLDISVPMELLADARTLDQLCAGIVQLGEGTQREPV